MSRITIGADQISVSNARLPFQEQIEAVRKRTQRLIPTERWTDVMHNAHDRSFVVAGAMKADLLADFAGAVEKLAADGKSIGWFREQFDSIVERHGWAYRGERNWRTRVIYTTNLRTSYATGRLAQLRDPDLRKVAPYWMYRHGGSADPRPQHLAWDGLTLPADHEWFHIHYPPNGWGCSCRVVAVRAKDVERLGGRWVDTPPPDPPGAIDHGWAYMPGASVADELRELVAQKAAGLPAPLGAAFRESMAHSLIGEPQHSLISLAAVDTEHVEGIRQVLTAFAAGNKYGWLPHGVVAVRTINEANLIAATDHRGYFVIGTHPLDGLGGRSALDVMTSALSKIKRGQPLDFHEEYGIESLWHEILHNSQRYRQPAGIDIELIRVAEGLHQSLARQSYPGLLEALGARAVHQDAIRKNGPAYAKSTASYYAMLGRLGLLDDSGAMRASTEAALRDVMFGTPYDRLGAELTRKLASLSGRPELEIGGLLRRIADGDG